MQDNTPGNVGAPHIQSRPDRLQPLGLLLGVFLALWPLTLLVPGPLIRCRLDLLVRLPARLFREGN